MTRQARLLLVLALNLGLVAGLVLVGVTAHSVGVLAAGGDYLADSGAIALALLTMRLKTRPSGRVLGGSTRAPAYGALANAVLLLLVVAVVAAESARRLVHGVGQVAALPVLLASVIAAVVMTGGALVLHGDARQSDDDDADQLNMRAVLLDTAADAGAAAGVATTGAVILAAGRWYWLDPAVAFTIAVVVGWQALRLLNDIIRTLKRQNRAVALSG